MCNIKHRFKNVKAIFSKMARPHALAIAFGYGFIACELVWIVYWAVMMFIFNFASDVPPGMESEHFVGVLHAFGLGIVILAVNSLRDERKHYHLIFQLVALLIVCFIDTRGVIRTAIGFPLEMGTRHWREFAGVTSIALALTAMEFIWLSIVVLIIYCDPKSKKHEQEHDIEMGEYKKF